MKRDDQRWKPIWTTFREFIALLVLMGLWYLGFLALYAFTG